MKLTATIVLILGLLLSSNTYARGLFRFGDQDNLHFLQDVKLKGANKEALYLGYRTTTKFFLAGVYLTDHGYVLPAKENKDSKEESYYTLTDEQMRSYQSQGLLPKPLPIYKIETLDYLIGYSLWLIILVGLIYYGVKIWIKKNKEQDSPA